ncbi:MAG: hypothetical protein WBM53_12670 [Maribacter sp.]
MIKMDFKPNVPKPFVLLLPLVGIGLFVLLYIIAAIGYPGGSWAVPHHEGFSFWNNYLCDLLDKYAINGELNSGRYFARFSLAALCSGILLLWVYLPGLFSSKSINKRIMWYSGILSLISTLFLTSGTHDITVRIAGFFGVIAFISCFIELFKAGHYKLFTFGVLCLGIFLLNYYIYETGTFIRNLPIIQKVTFVSFILWFVFLDIFFFRNVKTIQDKSTKT